MEAVIEDMKIQIKEMEKISRPKKIGDIFNSFFRHSMFAQLKLLDIENEHLEKQNDILKGKYDTKLKTFVCED